MATRRLATITCGETEKRCSGGPAVALSAAITMAGAGRATGDATFYVRDEDGEAYGRVERDDHGNLAVWRRGAAK